MDEPDSKTEDTAPQTGALDPTKDASTGTTGSNVTTTSVTTTTTSIGSADSSSAATVGAALDADRIAEKTKWSNRYATDRKFKRRIDRFAATRANLMAMFAADQGNEEERDRAVSALATDLAIAFGMVDRTTRTWTDEVHERSMLAGMKYAEPSVKSNTVAAIPGIVRSAILLGLEIGGELMPASYLTVFQGGMFVTYAATQLLLNPYLALWNANAQSQAVALQGTYGPLEMPAVKSDSLKDEQGKEIALRKKKAVRAELAQQQQLLKTAPNDRTAFDAVARLKMELYVLLLYKQLVVVQSQGDNRLLRTTMNIAPAAIGLYSHGLAKMYSEAGGMRSFFTAGLTAVSLSLLVAQPILYSLLQGKAAGRDHLSKIATMFKIVVMTGLGRLIDANGQIEPSKLNAIMKGPIAVRLEYVKSVLEYDKSVYLTAMFAFAQKGSRSLTSSPAEDMEALEAGYDVELGTHPFIQAATSPAKSYAEINSAWLAHGHKALTDMAPGYARQIQQVHARVEELSALLTVLATPSKDMLANFLAHAALAGASHQVVLGALEFASGRDTSEAKQACDDTLSEYKGYTESRTNVRSIHQAAQKLGQAYAIGFAGSAGPNTIKAIFNLASGCLLLVGDEDAEDLISAIGYAQNSLQILGSVIAMGLGYAYQNFISVKARLRQRDKFKDVLPNSGVLDDWGLIRLDRVRGRITIFSTLLAKPIDDLLQAQELTYEVDTNFAKDVLSQMIAVNLLKLPSYLFTTGGSLNLASDQDAEALIRAARTYVPPPVPQQTPPRLDLHAVGGGSL
ncbi:hypothetical protein VARIO8X_90338 [Burkholderiales bacterium 8X]|nr:hypothetical protein VARIO8X_90338 [Burkholderiales bacterium 8X]